MAIVQRPAAGCAPRPSLNCIYTWSQPTARPTDGERPLSTGGTCESGVRRPGGGGVEAVGAGIENVDAALDSLKLLGTPRLYWTIVPGAWNVVMKTEPFTVTWMVTPSPW